MLKADPWTRESRTRIGRDGDAIGGVEDLLVRRFSGSAEADAGAV
jgi:hypothetical protein